MGLFHHVLVDMGDLHLVLLALKFDDVLLDHVGLPRVISLAVHLDFFLVDK